jgi:hypothetical protein
MQRKQKTIYCPLPPVRLFLDDLEKIVDILQQVSSNIEIETDEYKLTSLQDLQKLNAQFINNLRFVCSTDKDPIRQLLGPILSIDLKENSPASLTLTQGTPAFRGAFGEVRDLLCRST